MQGYVAPKEPAALTYLSETEGACACNNGDLPDAVRSLIHDHQLRYNYVSLPPKEGGSNQNSSCVSPNPLLIYPSQINKKSVTPYNDVVA